jgi:hypothetical protein
MLSSRVEQEVADIVAGRGTFEKCRNLAGKIKRSRRCRRLKAICPPLRVSANNGQCKKHRYFRLHSYLLVSLHTGTYIGQILDTDRYRRDGEIVVGHCWTRGQQWRARSKMLRWIAAQRE